MDVGGARKFRVSSRALVPIIAVCALLLVSAIWNLAALPPRRGAAIAGDRRGTGGSRPCRGAAIAGDRRGTGGSRPCPGGSRAGAYPGQAAGRQGRRRRADASTVPRAQCLEPNERSDPHGKPRACGSRPRSENGPIKPANSQLPSHWTIGQFQPVCHALPRSEPSHPDRLAVSTYSMPKSGFLRSA